MTNNSCYCGSGKLFEQCCEPIINQIKIACTPEQLMRSRFSAFYLNNEAWLKLSWDDSTRPSNIQFEDGLNWLDLTIINHANIDNLNATVEFEARYLKSGKVQAIHENSHFIKCNGHWFYVNGDYLKTTFKAYKAGRNELCPCGSKIKFKNCCSS